MRGIDILHVDDEPEVAELAASFLEQEDDRISVQTATSPAEALEILEDQDIDCIISDYEMPETNGIEFLEVVRESHPELPFILFTGRGSEEVASEAISAGVTDYLQKQTGTGHYELLANRVTNAVRQHRTERRAAKTARQLEAILENTTRPMFMKDRDGQYLVVNEAYRDLFGFEEGEVIGQTDQDLFPQEMAEMVQANDRRVLESDEPLEAEEEIIVDGETRIFLSSKVPIYDIGTESDAETPVAVFGVATDITDRKDRFERLEQRFQAIFDHTYQFTGLLEPDGTVIEANNTALEFGGITHEDVVGKPFWETYWWQIDEETKRELREAIDRAASGEFVRYDVEVQGEDEVITIDFSLRPVTDEDGEVVYLIPEGRNITDLKTLQRQKRELQRYERLISNLPVGVFRSKPSGKIVSANSAVASLFGAASTDQLHEMTLQNLWLGATDGSDLLDEVRQAGIVRDREVRVETLDGEPRWIEATIAYTTEGDEEYLDGILKDTTEKRRERRRYSRTNTLLRSIMDELPVGVLAEDATGDVMAVNEQYLDMWDIAASPGEVREWDTDRIFEEISDSLAAPEAFASRTKRLRDTNSQVTDSEVELAGDKTYSRTHRIFDLPEGRGYLWIYEDVSDRKELERTKNRITRVLDLSDVVIWELDPETERLSHRGPTERVFGVEADELGDWDAFVESIVHPDDRPRVEKLGTLTDGGDPAATEALFRTRPDLEAAHRIWAQGSPASMEADEGAGLVGFAADVTDFVNLDRMAGEDAWYQTLIEHSVDITAVIDASGTMEYKNPALTYHLGYDSHEVVGGNALELVHPDDRSRVQEAITPVIEGEEYRSEPYEYRFRHADGSWRWFESVLTDCTTTPIDGYLVNSRDITVRKNAEKNLQRTKERMEEFASIVSHDLQNPINLLSGQLELAEQTGDQQHFDRCYDTIDRMDRLVEDLLVLARHGDVSGKTEPVALADAATRCWGEVETPDATITVETEQTIRASEGHLRQVLTNLFGNAITHSDGPVTVTVDTLDGGDGFYVADDGPGIPEDRRDDIFEAGYTTSDSGTGFGLRIVTQIAEAHGWEITVTESEDGGARFEFTGVETVGASGP